MDKMTWQEAKEYMRKFNEKHRFAHKQVDKICTIVAVISEDSFKDKQGNIIPYSLEARSYSFCNDNKAFLPDMLGYSIYAGSLDHTDEGVRIERYIDEEYGGKDGWKVEYCYITREDT